MTFLVRVSDPTCPDQNRIMESAKAFAEAKDNPLKALLQLHDCPSEFVFDLDDPQDRETFEKAYGEELALRTIHLEEGETFMVMCTKRVDDWEDDPEPEEQEEEPMPVLAEEPRRCACGGRPRILHEPGKGYAVQCEECWTSKGTWDLQLSKAIARWNGKEVDQ
ncbi:MAG: hypothetical protein IJI97_00200 [Clostridia bacterium]|nr:hypothetical protein [Clostridia bacterium]